MALIPYLFSKVEKYYGYLRLAAMICITVLLLFAAAILLFFMIGGNFASDYSYCNALYFESEDPNALNLPDLRNMSISERASLQEGSYKLSSDYSLKLTQDYLGVISLCVLKKYHTRVSACFEIGTNLEEVVVCSPEMRPDCLPGSIVNHYFGVSLWYQNDSTVEYSVVDIDSSASYGKELTNTTTTLTAVWLYVLAYCEVTVEVTIALIIFGVLEVLSICCLVHCVGCFVCCFSNRKCCQNCRYKCVDTLIVTYEWLMKQKQDDELALSNLQETNGYPSRTSFESLEEGGEEKETSFGPSTLLHQDGLPSAFLDVSSSEEEELEKELLPAGSLSSRDSICTALSETGHRRHGRRNRFVPTRRPLAGYFTDSTSMSGAGTDVSTNDASDEGSSEEDAHGQVSSASSVTMMVQQEATRVNTPPLFARSRPASVYDDRPGVTIEPRQPPAPLDPLRQNPILRDLNNKVVVRVAGKWETTGLELDIEGYVLQAIKTPNGSNEFHCREMFRRWLAREQGCGALPRTWSSVLDAVERSCGSEVSRELRELIH